MATKVPSNPERAVSVSAVYNTSIGTQYISENISSLSIKNKLGLYSMCLTN